MDKEMFAIIGLCIFYLIDKYRLVKAQKQLKAMEKLLYQQKNENLTMQDSLNTEPIK